MTTYKVKWTWTRPQAIDMLSFKYSRRYLAKLTDDALKDLGEKENLWKIVKEKEKDVG